MSNRVLSVCLFVILPLLLTRPILAQESKQVLVHYMPWFASKPISGEWGWHWKMKNCDPDSVNGDRRNIASHYYPLIGPYDSNDPDALECHVLLMKSSGIDGVVIDWYGIEDHWDYAAIHRNSRHLVRFIKKAGLKFCVCYEDQTVKHLIEAQIVESESQMAHGQKTLNWLQQNWFQDKAYVRIKGRPVMLVFGPQFYPGNQLKLITDSIQDPPLLFALPHLAEAAGADGVFGWPPVAGGKPVTRNRLNEYFKDLEEHVADGRQLISVVFPQFHDFYREGEDRPSYGSIENRSGRTFHESFQGALSSPHSLVQVATWNDYGEGTMIEPTHEFGYQYLELIQARMNQDKPVDSQNLRLPVKLYKLRKSSSQSESEQMKLNQASDFLFAAKYEQAAAILDELDKRAPK